MRFECAIEIKIRISSCRDFAWNIQIKFLKMGVKIGRVVHAKFWLVSNRWNSVFPAPETYTTLLNTSCKHCLTILECLQSLGMLDFAETQTFRILSIFVSKIHQNLFKGSQFTKGPVEKILLDSGFFFSELRTAFIVWFSPEVQSGCCLLCEIVWHKILNILVF